ncbi:MAG: hypothetical protein KDK70_22670 [Myxococcales bacterium]|nr:hypothetical protein [Myxococcales bacterium]
MAWEPTATATGSDSTGSSTGTQTDPVADESGGACEPGQLEPCVCPDGLSLGEQRCTDEGSGFGECECADDATETSGDPMPPLPEEVCYLGADRAGTTCIPLGAFYAELPFGYEYPPAMRPDGQDRPPIGMVDIEAVRGTISLAPNFALDELAQLAVGRWAVLQPHAIESLQAMRDQAGSIGVVTGYLSPSANAAAGGELYARHQYGDGFDLSPFAVTLGELAGLCAAEGGTAVEFEDHIHCEFSAVPLDEAFFGPAPGAGAPGPDTLEGLDAWIEPDGHGYWAPAVGFVEGEPLRRWIARNGVGEVLASEEGRWFEPPVGTASVEVLVGGRVRRVLDSAD